MAYPTFKEILISYANSRGGGLPLSAEEICNATVLWVQEEFDKLSVRLTQDITTSSISAATEVAEGTARVTAQEVAREETKRVILYDNIIEGSDTVVVDINENNTALEVRLDGQVVADIGRGIKTPMSAPTEPSVPVVGENNAVSYQPLSQLGGGGDGGTKLYKHDINGGANAGGMTIITTYEEKFTKPINLYWWLPNDYANNIKDGFICMYNNFNSGGQITCNNGAPTNEEGPYEYQNVTFEGTIEDIVTEI